MPALLDINVLIALFDPAHVHHETAHAWLTDNLSTGWASCPLTQNGCVRILSQPKYPNSITLSDAIARLSRAVAQQEHRFWPDDLSIVDANFFATDRILSHRQLTDLYLLALAVHRGGRLVTFDNAIPLNVVIGSKSQHLIVL